MIVVRSVEEMRALGAAWRAAGKRVGFVPTMGYLHRGHTSLVALARPRCEVLVVSIYVNPLQFGPGEDLARYPRDPEGDAEKCRAAGVDVEPPAQCRLADATAALPGVVGAGVPGAGGADALFALVVEGGEAAVERAWAAHGEGTVTPLLAGEGAACGEPGAGVAWE